MPLCRWLAMKPVPVVRFARNSRRSPRSPRSRSRRVGTARANRDPMRVELTPVESGADARARRRPLPRRAHSPTASRLRAPSRGTRPIERRRALDGERPPRTDRALDRVRGDPASPGPPGELRRVPLSGPTGPAGRAFRRERLRPRSPGRQSQRRGRARCTPSATVASICPNHAAPRLPWWLSRTRLATPMSYSSGRFSARRS